jgi:hypothetical protein
MVKTAVFLVAVVGAVWFLYPHHSRQYQDPGKVEDRSLSAPADYLESMPRYFERHHESSHTYRGMVLAGADARVVYANETSYCIEAGDYHLNGPDGAPVRGRCPAG